MGCDSQFDELYERHDYYNVAPAPKERRSIFSYPYYNVLRMIGEESTKARSKHQGAPQATEDQALSILVEEVGEIATALNQNLPKAELEKEIVQVASVATRWLMGDLTYSRKA